MRGCPTCAGSDFRLGYSPERIDPGNITWPFEQTPKVVSGVDAESLAVVRDFYDTLVDTTVPVSSPQVAELTKLLENTFRHVNIALVNELAMFARELGIDIWEAIDAASTKPYGYLPFRPGPGVGGHCLPIDPSYLSWRVKRSTGRTFRFVELANDINDHMPDYVVQRLARALNRRDKPVRGSRVLLLGLGADVRAVDPHVVEAHVEGPVRRTELTVEEVAAADAVVLLTNHDDFDLDIVGHHGRYVLDCRRALGAGDRVELL